MYLLDLVLPIGYFDFFGRLMLAKFLVGIGMVIALLALIQFRLAKTTVDPTKPDKAQSLVISGVFKFSRNPMYLWAMLLIRWLLLVL